MKKSTPKDSTKLSKIMALFKHYLPQVHASRLQTLTLFVIAVLHESTVNQVKLSCYANGNTQLQSRQKRFKRLLCFTGLCMNAIAKLMLSMAKANNKSQEGFIVALDRTNSKLGQKHINLLMASVYCKGVGYPIVWKMLPQESKRGNSTT